MVGGRCGRSGLSHLQPVVEALAAALRARVGRPCGGAHGAKVLSAVPRPFESPPHEQHALPLRLEVVHQLVEPAHPARIELRVVLQDEERSALVVLPPLDDVFEESVVAQVGCNGAPADDRAGEAVVFQEVALNCCCLLASSV